MGLTSYREAIARSMKDALRTNPGTIVYGLCITDHTGIFGTTLGLKKEFGPVRVFDTPLSEDAMTGFAVGAALNGLYPIHVHMRCDFMMLAVNQLVNSAAKYKYMYGGRFKVPMLIRGVIGRSWGQGAQHSQSPQALFSHVPGLEVVMPSSASRVKQLYSHAVNRYKSPVISLEHRLLYDYLFADDNEKETKDPFTSYLVKKGSDVTIVATSIMVQESQRAADFVKKVAGINVEIIDLNCLTHPDEEMIIKSINKTGRLIVADTSWAPYGVCSDVCRIVASSDPSALKAPVELIAPAGCPCPTTKALERHFYPDMGDMAAAIYRLCSGNKKHSYPLPDEEYKKKFYKEFKGPF